MRWFAAIAGTRSAFIAALAAACMWGAASYGSDVADVKATVAVQSSLNPAKMEALRGPGSVQLHILAATKAAAVCFNLANGEPHSLNGMLYYTIAPGPPNFQDVKQGDTPEPIYVLRLSQPICLTGDEFADPTKPFLEVQLVPRDEIAKAMRSLVTSSVSVTLAQPMAAFTGHHHRPLVAWVTAISPAPIEPTDDLTKDYGTAATSVRAFYYALGDGNGDQAAQFIVRERRKGPLSASEMTRFYGELIEPLRLLSVTPVPPDGYLVRYSFTSKVARCDGRALVTTTTRENRNLIYKIKALDGC